MHLPTLKHLREIGIERLQQINIAWEPFGRCPWRIQSLVDGEVLRKPLGRKTVGYPDGLPGLPYEFSHPHKAISFVEGCIAKLRRNSR